MKLFLVECTDEEARVLRDDLFDSSPAMLRSVGRGIEVPIGSHEGLDPSRRPRIQIERQGLSGRMKSSFLKRLKALEQAASVHERVLLVLIYVMKCRMLTVRRTGLVRVSS